MSCTYVCVGTPSALTRLRRCRDCARAGKSSAPPVISSPHVSSFRVPGANCRLLGMQGIVTVRVYRILLR